LRRFVHYFAGCRKDVPRHRQQPSLSRYMVFSCLLFISQINLGLRTVGSYNPPIVGAGYWISRYFFTQSAFLVRWWSASRGQHFSARAGSIPCMTSIFCVCTASWWYPFGNEDPLEGFHTIPWRAP
jgi:hypothetical protein